VTLPLLLLPKGFDVALLILSGLEEVIIIIVHSLNVEADDTLVEVAALVLRECVTVSHVVSHVV
jgi:hypothetical protein